MEVDEHEYTSQISVGDLVDLGTELVASILAREPREQVLTFIDDKGAPLWYQDEEGLSALHAACFVEDAELVRELLKRGAVWNSMDDTGNTPGDIALSFNNEECYRPIRDEGVRSEFLLHFLNSKNETPSAGPSSAIVLKAVDSTAAGSTDEFLKTPLRYTKDEHGQEVCFAKVKNRMGEDQEVGVMMGWEREIMRRTVDKLYEPFKDGTEDGELHVLNVGFGLGIIDGFFQQLPKKPTKHAIIEPHPDVLAHMREQGWYDKPGVVVLEGKWQDFIEGDEVQGVGGFDIIYTDTFSEDYAALKQMFEEVVGLLRGPTSRFSFFHGLGATNATFYDVYTQVAELHLSDAGLATEWEGVDVRETGRERETRWGTSRKYFEQPWYWMPVCSMAVTI